MATFIASDWVVIVIGLLFKCSLNVHCAIFNIYQQGRGNHLTSNMDVLNSKCNASLEIEIALNDVYVATCAIKNMCIAPSCIGTFF